MRGIVTTVLLCLTGAATGQEKQAKAEVLPAEIASAVEKGLTGFFNEDFSLAGKVEFDAKKRELSVVILANANGGDILSSRPRNSLERVGFYDKTGLLIARTSFGVSGPYFMPNLLDVNKGDKLKCIVQVPDNVDPKQVGKLTIDY